MGMYTELVCSFRLRKDVPAEVIEMLTYMATGEGDQPNTLDHPLFSTDRWHVMLMMDSYCFDGDTCSTVRFDDITRCHMVSIRCNLKNYCGEIDKFIDWLTPHIDASEGEFLGHKRYEEDDNPTLLYHPNRWERPRFVSNSQW